MRRGVLFLAIGVLASASACGAPGTPRARPAPSARAADAPGGEPVVVTLVVDQLAAWVLDERIGELPADGGFARLAREGTRARDVRYAHAVTDTAPGHAALYTGAPPRASGVFGNEVVDDATGKRVSVLVERDDAAPGATPPARAVDASGVVAGSHGSSAAILRAPTVADRLRAERPDAYVVSVSLKDRGAIFGGGRAPDASVWYDHHRGVWITSTAFARALPAWAARAPLADLPAEWTLLDAPWVEKHALTPDDQPGEGDYAGLGVVFPHPLGAAREPSLAFRASPAANDALLALGLAALADPRAPQRRERPTLLAISLSANDYVGHVFGPDSWEAWDELRRLDASLARFFAALDARFGADGWSAVLSADHGVTRMPEVLAARGCAMGASMDPWQRPCDPGVRILPDELAGELARAAEKAMGPGRWISGVADPYVYLARDARALDAAKKEQLLRALEAAARAHAGIAAVYRVEELTRGACAPDADESVDALVCRATFPGRGGALYMVARPGSFFDPDVVVGKGTSHGSPYLFDRAVPLLARAPGRVKAGALLDGPIGFGAFARTASALLGVAPPPAAASARDLTAP